MTKLTHNQEIRVKGFTYASRITVGTAAGYAKDYNEPVSSTSSRGCPEPPWTNQEGAMLVADYPGKAADFARAAEATAAAVEIGNDDVVEIEGHQFKVRIVGQQYSDPVHFIPA